MHPLITMGARENLKLDILDFGCLRVAFIENAGKKILPPKENLMPCQQGATTVGEAPHPPLQDMVWPNLLRLRLSSSFSHINCRVLNMPRGPLTKNLIPPPGFKVQKADLCLCHPRTEGVWEAEEWTGEVAMPAWQWAPSLVKGSWPTSGRAVQGPRSGLWEGW